MDAAGVSAADLRGAVNASAEAEISGDVRRAFFYSVPVGCLIDRTRFVSMDEVSSEDEELQSRPRNLSSPTQA